MRHVLAVFLMAAAVTVPVHAAERFTPAAWYAALEAADAEALAPMLATEAEITIVDLDITQSRDDFLGSMVEWGDAMDGGTLRHRVEAESENEVTITVCYGFASGDVLAREVFMLNAEGLVASSVQETIGEACGDI